ncbi:MAG: peptidoglycan -binding protein [Sedimenticola sp.]|nr:peptidoglycan -binding protein [Sedimenticola sp.]
MLTSSRRSKRHIDVWPGYVDALSALLILVIFVLMLFTFAQFLLSELLSSQESELVVLNRQINQLTRELGLQKEANAKLQNDVGQLSDMVSSLTGEKFQLASRIDSLQQENQAGQEQIEQQLLTLASLQEDISALRLARESLEQEVGRLAASLDQSEQTAGQLRDRSKALQARLADQQERTLLAQREVESKEIRIQALTALVGTQRESLEQQRKLSDEARIQVAALSQRIDQLQQQLQEVNSALSTAEQENLGKEQEIKRLGERLNIELARRVNRLEKYRSEFFGRLRELLGDNPSIRVVGDRFLFQSELLFASGSARLGDEGKQQLGKLAGTLKSVADRIPVDIQWILRVDGHTDRIPINNERFPSNWELSTARAVSVVRYLASQGIPEKRLSAAGFGEFHPIDSGGSEEALRRNRRIEIKLTSL